MDMPNTLSNTPKIVTYNSVNRERTLFSISVFLFGRQYVPGAAPGVNQRTAEPFVNLLSQAAHVNINDVRHRVKIFVPHVLGDLFAAEQSAPMQREKFEQSILVGRQVNAPARANRRVVGGVQNQIGDPQHGGPK